MPEFLILLSLYYGCDALMAHKPLSLTGSQLVQCSAYYEAVKSEFADAPFPASGTQAGVSARRDAYRAFKAWELENEALVTTMRADAAARVIARG